MFSWFSSWISNSSNEEEEEEFEGFSNSVEDSSYERIDFGTDRLLKSANQKIVDIERKIDILTQKIDNWGKDPQELIVRQRLSAKESSAIIDMVIGRGDDVFVLSKEEIEESERAEKVHIETMKHWENQNRKHNNDKLSKKLVAEVGMKGRINNYFSFN